VHLHLRASLHRDIDPAPPAGFAFCKVPGASPPEGLALREVSGAQLRQITSFNQRYAGIKQPNPAIKQFVNHTRMHIKLLQTLKLSVNECNSDLFCNK